MARDIIIVSSAYGYEKIQQLGGQSEVLGIVKKSGAEGIEIRRELFSEQDLQTLPQLSEKIKSSQLSCFYSVPYPLNYLIDSGFEAIIFITESLTGVGTRQERVNTFKKIVKQQKGIVGEVVEIEDMNQQTELLDQHIVSFCQKCRGMRKAIVTVNGSVTLHVSLALKRLNIIWGKDIGLLSFDDPVWASVAGVGITTLRQPTYKIGYSSFEMLHRRMQGDHSEAKEYLYPGELIIRDSTN
ncbi:substrate-binding domain-containing protein [Zophobihabitans entericus]|uniref:Substrate-binding domain-containing protein n=1 Tax=Zophobihabitans entericus TaxID=1635327 RepID=A0A6G9IBN2_9GAMM|nr:substrate-binding domain-containing protein [Zophobihabitans entericus]QIQ20990.1 substrate-binding domain-containing protein [Zophobihabitans entericus]